MTDLIARCLVELGELNEADPWVLILPAGALAARDGRTWQLADPAAVVARSLAHAGGTELVIDYEHQTDHAQTNGQRAPAAGWMKALRADADGVWARIDWTEAARAHLQAKEYRYFSPTFTHDKTGRVKMILRGALTNKPALDLPALATTREDCMHDKHQALLAKFGLTPEQTDDEPALDAALARAEAALAPAPLTAVAAALGLAEDADEDTILARCTALQGAAKPDPAEFVPMTEFRSLATELKALQDEQAAAKATAAVDAGVRAGQITPAMRDWALSYAQQDLAGFTAYLAAQPVLVAPGAQSAPAAVADPQAALSAAELAVCRALGITPDQYKASRQDILAMQAGESA